MKKLYSDYAPEETITISGEDMDDRELAKRLRSDPFPFNLCEYGEGQAKGVDRGGGKQAHAQEGKSMPSL